MKHVLDIPNLSELRPGPPARRSEPTSLKEFKGQEEFLDFLIEHYRTNLHLSVSDELEKKYPNLGYLVNKQPFYAWKAFLPGTHFNMETLKFWSHGYANEMLNLMLYYVQNGMPHELQNAINLSQCEHEPVLQREYIHTEIPRLPQDKTPIRLFSNPTNETCTPPRSVNETMVLKADKGIWCHVYPMWIWTNENIDAYCRLDISTTADAIMYVYNVHRISFNDPKGNKLSFHTVRLQPEVQLFVNGHDTIRRLLFDGVSSRDPTHVDVYNSEIDVYRCVGVIP